MNLVIVESPAKAKTIEKYLGKDFKVLASFGHVRDLPQKELGVDVKNNFEPEYVISPGSKKVLAEIKISNDKAKELYLATDLDREGEAISWHLVKALKLKEDDPKIKRIVFSEITKSALEKAVQHPRGIDMNLVDAQQARRVLDRLVGYKLSPLLWEKVMSGLSAGRVQSVAVRLVVEREREIEKFKPEEYWLMGVILSKVKDELKFNSYLIEADGESIKKLDIKNKKQADEIEKGLTGASYKVLQIDKTESMRRPSPPFTTSTMQMEASRKLGYYAKQTMRLAQKLYESGRITYMRTDSTNMSGDAISTIRKLIVSEYGQKYLPGKPQIFAQNKRAQEAHEAIRPTDFDKRSEGADSQEQKLYELIWKRAVASQMKEAILDVTSITIEAKAKKRYLFLTKGEVMRFEGFIKVYTEGRDEEVAEVENQVPELTVNEALEYHDTIKDQKFTEPPKRYTEAMLVKKLESLDIGRPSTYAPTLSTIQDRGYVTLEDKKFKPQEIGTIVNDLLVEHFSEVVDFDFTAKMEDELDDIADGKRKWVPVIEEFYTPFAKNLTEKNKEIEKDDIMKPEETKEKCPECKKPLVIRHGRFGKFMACSGYPDCKYSRPLDSEKSERIVDEKGKLEKVKEELDQKCEKCGGNMILKEGRFGKFLACENYPKCKNTKTIIQPTGMKCPDCGEGDVVERRTKRGKMFWGCSRYPGCKYASWQNPTTKMDNPTSPAEPAGQRGAGEINEPQKEQDTKESEPEK